MTEIRDNDKDTLECSFFVVQWQHLKLQIPTICCKHNALGTRCVRLRRSAHTPSQLTCEKNSLVRANSVNHDDDDDDDDDEDDFLGFPMIS